MAKPNNPWSAPRSEPPAPIAGAVWVALPRGKFALVDEADAERVSRHRWHINNGYVARKVTVATNKMSIEYLHRMLMGLEIGERGAVDHINGDRVDNRRSNLRLATKEDNMHNRPMEKRNTSGFKGVSWEARNRRWKAGITRNGRTVYLGLYDAAEDAAHAYDEAARKYFGAFAAVNFPRSGERGIR